MKNENNLTVGEADRAYRENGIVTTFKAGKISQRKER